MDIVSKTYSNDLITIKSEKGTVYWNGKLISYFKCTVEDQGSRV